MKIFEGIKSSVSKIRTNLISLGKQPLSNASVIIVIFLDIFILFSIFDGLGKHTAQLSSPEDYVPSVCREIILDKEWNPSTRLDNLSFIITSYNNSHYQVEEKRKERHPACVPLLGFLDNARKNKELAILFDEREKHSKEADKLQRDVASLKGAYDTSLLETIAKEKSGLANVDNIKSDINSKTLSLNSLRAQVQGIEQKINANTAVLSFWRNVEAIPQSDRNKLRADLRLLHSIFPLKKLGMQMIFLLPLFAVFFVWNQASIKSSRGVQILVSSHLLVVASIPIIFKLCETIYDIIPKILLKRLFELLESLKLVALWNYFVIAVAIGAGLFLIYLFQKKLFSREKLIERRITKGECQQCGKHLPLGSQACSFCGFSQYVECGNCSQPTYVFAKYCKQCGRSQQ